MLYNTKKEVVSVINTINKATTNFNRMRDYNDGIYQCLDAYNLIAQELDEYTDILNEIENQKTIYKSFRMKNFRSNSSFVKKCIAKNNKIKTNIIKNIDCKIKVVFMPYKAAMWDSFASIYEAAKEDKNCEVKVVPIPYYKCANGEEVLTYEGDNLPENVDVVDYRKFKIEEETPDIIYIHNIYDNINKITRVKDEYFTTELKKYTDMLVYAPYCVSLPDKRENIRMRVEYVSPSMQIVDKVILPGKFLEKEALESGFDKKKIMTLGSAKLDDTYTRLKNSDDTPMEWKSALDNKKVILLNTSCVFFTDNGDYGFTIINKILELPKYFDNIAVIWRPHPLTREEIKVDTPELVSKYDDLCNKIKEKQSFYKNIILDKTDDYGVAVNISDMLITVSKSSLLINYLLTNKPIMTLGDYDSDKWPLPDNLLYDVNSSEKPWLEVIKKLSAGEDLMNHDESKVMSELYENIDGTSGQKIYEAVKEEILSRIE